MWVNQETKASRKTENRERDMNTIRNCSTFVAVCNCHLIKRCFGFVDSKYKLYVPFESIYRRRRRRRRRCRINRFVAISFIFFSDFLLLGFNCSIP